MTSFLPHCAAVEEHCSSAVCLALRNPKTCCFTSFYSSVTLQVSFGTQQEFKLCWTCCINHIYTTWISSLFSCLCSDRVNAAHVFIRLTTWMLIEWYCLYVTVKEHRVTLYTWYFPLSSPLSLMNNVSLMASFSTLFPGLIAGDSISPVEDEVSGREGQSVTLICQYETSYSNPRLYWYRHHSDLQAPQFILWKGAKRVTTEYIPNNRYQSQTSDTSTSLTIRELTLADTALYYCALETQWYKV